MTSDGLLSPWRATFVLPGGPEPLSPRALLIQGLDDLGSPSVLEAKVGASVANDWREILRDLHPFKYEDMTVSLGSPGMPPRGGAGWLSPVVLDADSVAESQTPHHVKFPVSMISSRPINSQPFMLGPPPKSPARRTKLRSHEEEEVADILVMLRSRTTQQPAPPPSALVSDATQDSQPSSSPNSPENASSAAPSPLLMQTRTSESATPASPRLFVELPEHELPSEVDVEVEVEVEAADGDATPAAVELKHTHKTKLARDADWKPHARADPRPRRRTKTKRSGRGEDADADDQAFGGARSVDQSNELEKMLRDIGFMAIRTERTSISCSLCQQRFPSRMFAVRHAQRDHLGVKPFECNICHMRFVRLDSVPRHIKNVHQRKPTKRKRKRTNKS